ncbi:MAG: hypothetical protein WC455_20905 [Dehalococcoidia bacterium]|jgi:hypothetical protein
MPYAFVPPGYSAVLVAQAPDIEDLGAFAPLEESTAEGTLVLLKLDFLEPVPEEKLTEIERACRDAGVESWPGSEFYVYADTNTNSVYLIWQKGLAWLPIIIGIVGMTVLPPLLGTVLWWIIPDSLKNLISSLVNMGMMLLMMWLMTSMMKPLMAPAKAKPKQVKEAAG